MPADFTADDAESVNLWYEAWVGLRAGHSTKVQKEEGLGICSSAA